jgi:hypothetical protein
MKGYLYVLFNEVYKMYGEHVYKLGRTINEINRMRSYTTPFKDKSKYLYVSSQFDNCLHAERVLFWVLRHRRVRKEREFFDISLDGAIEIIKRLEALDTKVISELYYRLLHSVCPEHLVERVINGEDMQDSEFDEKIKDPFAYLEKFRFRPKNPAMYPGWVPPEEMALNKLLYFKSIDDDSQDDDLQSAISASAQSSVYTDRDRSWAARPKDLECNQTLSEDKLSSDFKNSCSVQETVVIEDVTESVSASAELMEVDDEFSTTLVVKPKRRPAGRKSVV